MKNSTKTIALANQKGGVGKTTTTINLGACLAESGQKTLVIDLDPQCNATTGLGINHRSVGWSSHELLQGQFEPSKILTIGIESKKPETRATIDLIPAHIKLAGIELEISNDQDKTNKMRQAMTTIGQLGYDYVLIDCPPALSLLTVNGLVGTDTVIVPVQCEYYALEGLTHLMNTIRTLKKQRNPSLEIEGFLLTMYDKRNRLSNLVVDDVRKHLKDKVYETVIPRNVRVSEAPSHGLPITAYDHVSSGSIAYQMLTQEVLRQNI